MAIQFDLNKPKEKLQFVLQKHNVNTIIETASPLKFTFNAVVTPKQNINNHTSVGIILKASRYTLFRKSTILYFDVLLRPKIIPKSEPIIIDINAISAVVSKPS